MKTFSKSILALAVIGTSASVNASIVFDFSLLGGEASYAQASATQTDATTGLTLTATTTTGSLAMQPNGVGLGVGTTSGTWTIIQNEDINFALTDVNGDPVDFSLNKLVLGEGGLFGWGERAEVAISGNTYKVGGNNLNNALASKKWIQPLNTINPNNTSQRGAQYSWGADGAGGVDIDNNFTLTGKWAASGNTSYRLRSVDLTVEGSYATPVPVPAAAWLFGSALMGLTVAKRRK